MELIEIPQNSIKRFFCASGSKLLERVLVIALSTLSLYLSTEYWCFTWVALLLLCIYSLRNSVSMAFVVGFTSYLLGSINPHTVLPIVIYWPLITVNAIAFAGVLVVFHLIADKWRGRNTSIIFASGLTAQEFVFALYSPHGTVSSIAYTQAANLPIIQIASITGIEAVNIVFVPALDFHDDAWSHTRIAVMRGVEGDFAVARAGQWGLLTLSDSRGRIVEKVFCDNTQDDAMLIGEVLLGQGRSIYSKIGNSFAWICLGTFVILSALAFIKP